MNFSQFNILNNLWQFTYDNQGSEYIDNNQSIIKGSYLETKLVDQNVHDKFIILKGIQIRCKDS